jgi:coenzyme F420-reducing hydrogenase beta subunit
MNISNFQQCSNCGACYNICPKGAISVKEDGLFYTPMVDHELCVDCSLCSRVCPVNGESEGNQPIYACAGWHKEKEVVLGSSSGGVFYGLAQRIISDGGVVFAAIYSKDCKTVEVASSDDVPLNRMLKSKYVESLVGLSFQKIKKELEAGRNVLFCGTPCQVAGLQSYLCKTYNNLITCDFACGGLPSHKIYRDHLYEIESKYRSTVRSVDFRPKTHGWKRYALRIGLTNGKEYLRLATEDPYLGSFLYGKYTVRDYCMDCKFPEYHASDLTIADFWLHEKLSSLKRAEGISLILCNTPKGKQLIDAIGDQYIFSELDVKEAAYNNRLQIASEPKKAKRVAFLRDYEKNGLRLAYERFFPCSLAQSSKNWMIRKLFRK